MTVSAIGRSKRRLRVLLAEDNPVNQRLAVRLLERRGHTVVATGNGREVLALLAKQPFDVVLMDVQMPEMDGLEATAAIRDREKGTGLHLPVVAMTAHAMKGDRERCLEAGMDNYVAKPLQVKELLAVIEGLVPPSAGGEVSVPAAQCEGEVLDREALLSSVGGDRELLREITDLCLESCSRLLSKLREALARGESKALGEATHALKGAVSSFCARGAWQAVLRLETIIRERDLARAQEAFAALEREIARLTSALAGLGKEEAS